MRYDTLMEESLCYKMIGTFYSYFLTSIFFRFFAGSVSAISGILKEALLYSESRRLFISTHSACRNIIPHLIPASILPVSKGAMKYAVSVYCGSYISRLIDKKI
ncbi:MAG: hypothetical protein V1682_05415 [Candidatus Omnitrophota bacterium]